MWSHLGGTLRRRVGWLVAVALMTPGLARADDPTDKDKVQDGKPATPAEEYQSLMAEYQAAEQEFYKQYQEAKTDEERGKLFEKYPVKTFVGRFLEFAEKYPKEPAAIDALTWVVQRARGSDPATAKSWNAAVDILIKDHIESEQIGGVVQSMVYSYSAKGEALMRSALDKSPHPAVQGQACLALAQYLRGQVRMAEGLRADPERAAQYESFLGKDMVRQLTEADLEEIGEEVEELLERVVAKYTSYQHWRGTLGKAAEGELFEIRNLAIGKVAPEIEGEDIDGVQFKLSDYRGKVVVLDFWGNW